MGDRLTFMQFPRLGEAGPDGLGRAVDEEEGLLEELGYKSRIMRKGSAAKDLTRREKQGNATKAKVRARVEHVFGSQANDMGGTLVRSIGAMRARAQIGLKNLAYNMRRLTYLETAAAATP